MTKTWSIMPGVAWLCLIAVGCERDRLPDMATASLSEPGVVRVTRRQYEALPRLLLERETVVCPDTSRTVCHFSRIFAHAIGPHGVSALFDPSGDESGGIGTRIFDSAGAYVRTLGRGGQGPGEHGVFIEIGFDAELGFTVFDANSGIVHRFDSSGVLLSSRKGPNMRGRLDADIEIGDGRVILFQLPAAAEGDTVDAPFLVAGSDTSTREITTVRARAFRTKSRSPTPLEGFYTAVPSWDAGVGPGVTILHSPGDRYVIQRFDSFGHRELMIEVDAPLDAVTTDDLAAARARWSRLLSDPSSIRELRPFTPREVRRTRVNFERGDSHGFEDEVASAETRAARYLPAISGLQVGVDGTIWAREERKALRDSTRWTTFAPSGAPLGFFVLPPGSSFIGGTRTRILVIENDRLDVPLPVWHRVLSVPLSPDH